MIGRTVFLLVLSAALMSCGGSSPPTTPIPPTNPPVNTVPSYAGTWTGAYSVTTCTQSGFFVDTAFCSSVLNTTAAVTFTFTQADRAVSGNFLLGSVTFPDVSASVATDGSLAFSSALTGGAFPIEASWTLRAPTGGTVKGTTRQVWKAAGQSGEAVLEGEIGTVTKTSLIGAR